MSRHTPSLEIVPLLLDSVRNKRCFRHALRVRRHCICLRSWQLRLLCKHAFACFILAQTFTKLLTLPCFKSLTRHYVRHGRNLRKCLRQGMSFRALVWKWKCWYLCPFVSLILCQRFKRRTQLFPGLRKTTRRISACTMVRAPCVCRLRRLRTACMLICMLTCMLTCILTCMLTLPRISLLQRIS